MYIFQGTQLGHPEEVDIYAMDPGLHIRESRSIKQPSDEWYPNSMLKKRDFQDQNPPRTKEEFYETYDPAVGWGTCFGLGFFLFIILFKVAAKWIWKKVIKRTAIFKKIQRFLKSRSKSDQPPAENSISVGGNPSVVSSSTDKEAVTTQITGLDTGTDTALRPGVHVKVVSPTPTSNTNTEGCLHPTVETISSGDNPSLSDPVNQKFMISPDTSVTTAATIELEPLLRTNLTTQTLSPIDSTLAPSTKRVAIHGQVPHNGDIRLRSQQESRL